MDRLFGLRFARPSFDFSQSLSEYNRFPSPTEADYLALRADWRVVGNDLRRATKYFTKSASTQRTIRSFPEPADG